MDFQKVASGSVLHRYGNHCPVCRESVICDWNFHTLFLFVTYSFFCRKGIHNLLSGNGFPGSGSMWHRLVEVGTDLVYILNPGNQQCGKRENRGLIQT